MPDQPITKREMQESLDVLQGAMNDGFAMQDAEFKNLSAQVKSVEERLDRLEADTSSILIFLKERIDRLDENIGLGYEQIKILFDTFSSQIDINTKMGEVIQEIWKRVGHLPPKN